MRIEGTFNCGETPTQGNAQKIAFWSGTIHYDTETGANNVDLVFSGDAIPPTGRRQQVALRRAVVSAASEFAGYFEMTVVPEQPYTLIVPDGDSFRKLYGPHTVILGVATSEAVGPKVSLAVLDEVTLLPVLQREPAPLQHGVLECEA